MLSKADLGAYYNKVRLVLNDLAGDKAQALWDLGQEVPGEDKQLEFYAAVLHDLVAVQQGVMPTSLRQASAFKQTPVGIREFVTSPEYMNKAAEIYPRVMDELEQMNEPQYQEIVLTGGIGCAKTTCALYTTAYQLYVLSCMRAPHAAFGLDPASEILFVFQSINKAIAAASFRRFRSMVESCVYFQRHFPHDKLMESKLVFPHRIEVVPVSGAETAAIGQNVIGGFIDELNYMSIVERSKQSVDQGTYDQAVALYNSIARRRKSRFLSGGVMPGKLCLVSSKRYPGQFTDMKEEEAKREIARTGSTSIYIYDYRVWDVKPPGSFKKERFQVFVGDDNRKPRILEPHEAAKFREEKDELVVEVPTDFREDFEKDIINALREIAGVSTLARHPFFSEIDKVTRCFGVRQSVIEQEVVDFKFTRPTVYKSRITEPEFKRFAHIDLALTHDSAGLVIGYVPKFVTVRKEENYEKLPVVAIDCALEIRAPINGEIEFSNIRRILYKLREFGMPIVWVTLDSYQSADTMQILRSEGFVTGYQSMDTTIVPYQLTKSALYDGRLMAPEHKRLKRELLTLERDFKRNKIDHPAHGSKDISDALAGVVYGLTMRREVWTQHNVNPMVAPSVYQTMIANRNKGRELEEAA